MVRAMVSLQRCDRCGRWDEHVSTYMFPPGLIASTGTRRELCEECIAEVEQQMHLGAWSL
jgi:hypothetical protein